MNAFPHSFAHRIPAGCLAPRRALMILSLFAGASALVPARAALPAEAFASVTEDGGWCWFSDPRAVSRDGHTYTGWVTEDGSI
ncbi:MAG TPA: hypothetical protein VGA56_03435 [Opitutaceae bacterium]